MRKKESPKLTILFLIALPVYFASEAVLRQATVSRINPEAVKVDEIIADLPSHLQEKIRYRMTMTTLQQALAGAGSDRERVNAHLSIAAFSQDTSEQESHYRKVLTDYPDIPNSYPVYARYLLNEESQRNLLTMDRFVAYQKKLPPEERYYAWTVLYNKLQSKKPKPSNDEIRTFLEPLLEIREPGFSEYFTLFDELAKYARLTKRTEVAARAAALAEKCIYLRSFNEYLVLREEEYRYKVNKQEKRSGIRN